MLLTYLLELYQELVTQDMAKEQEEEFHKARDIQL